MSAFPLPKYADPAREQWDGARLGRSGQATDDAHLLLCQLGMCLLQLALVQYGGRHVNLHKKVVVQLGGGE